MTNIDLICKQCEKTFTVLYKNRNRKFCSRDCVNSYQTGKNNPAFGKTYRTKETHPEWAMRVSSTHCERGHILGEKNPMKNREVATRMGASRSKKFQTDESFRQMTSDIVRQAWAVGKFDGVRVGKCKWHKFTKQDGTTCNLQGTWELAYAMWLDENGIPFIAHRGRITYLDEQGKTRSYYPDFYLPNSNEYVDIKNHYHFNLSKEKWKKIHESNPELKIVLLFEEELKERGIL